MNANSSYNACGILKYLELSIIQEYFEFSITFLIIIQVTLNDSTSKIMTTLSLVSFNLDLFFLSITIDSVCFIEMYRFYICTMALVFFMRLPY